MIVAISVEYIPLQGGTDVILNLYLHIRTNRKWQKLWREEYGDDLKLDAWIFLEVEPRKEDKR